MQESLLTEEPLALAHRAALAPLLARRWSGEEAVEATLADPWFANLYLFRAAHGWCWQAGDWPCISGHAYDGTRLLLPLFDLQAVPIDTLRSRLRSHEAYGPLSAAQAGRLDPAAWQLSHHRDDADYLYPADNFRHYRGRLLQKKRNLVRQLPAVDGVPAVEAVPYTPALADEAAQVLAGWLDDKAHAPGATDDGPCREALALADVLGLDGTLYRIDGRAAGFLLAEPVRPRLAVMRFAKALDRHKGLYQHMFQQFCRARPTLEWLNFEQDLGRPNFRQTKLSYQPIALLDKWRVAPR